MPEEKAIVRVEPSPPKPEDLFSDHERLALEAHRLDKSWPTLSPVLQVQLYELFLAGTSCEEIAKLNPGLTLGQILETRLHYGWDDRRNRYIEDLMAHAKERLQQTQLESMDHLRTTLAVAHRAFSNKAKKFLQTGNPKDLPEYSQVGLTWKQYRETLELLLKLTGQAPVERTEVSGTVTHQHVAAPGAAATIATGLTPAGAAAALEALESGRKKS
jgi:hypothetical protein